MAAVSHEPSARRVAQRATAVRTLERSRPSKRPVRARDHPSSTTRNQQTASRTSVSSPSPLRSVRSSNGKPATCSTTWPIRSSVPAPTAASAGSGAGRDRRRTFVLTHLSTLRCPPCAGRRATSVRAWRTGPGPDTRNRRAGPRGSVLDGSGRTSLGPSHGREQQKRPRCHLRHRRVAHRCDTPRVSLRRFPPAVHVPDRRPGCRCR
jgi:hypothetical protein